MRFDQTLLELHALLLIVSGRGNDDLCSIIERSNIDMTSLLLNAQTIKQQSMQQSMNTVLGYFTGYFMTAYSQDILPALACARNQEQILEVFSGINPSRKNLSNINRQQALRPISFPPQDIINLSSKSLDSLIMNREKMILADNSLRYFLNYGILNMLNTIEAVNKVPLSNYCEPDPVIIAVKQIMKQPEQIVTDPDLDDIEWLKYTLASGKLPVLESVGRLTPSQRRMNATGFLYAHYYFAHRVAAETALIWAFDELKALNDNQHTPIDKPSRAAGNIFVPDIFMAQKKAATFDDDNHELINAIPTQKDQWQSMLPNHMTLPELYLISGITQYTNFI